MEIADGVQPKKRTVGGTLPLLLAISTALSIAILADAVLCPVCNILSIILMKRTKHEIIVDSIKHINEKWAKNESDAEGSEAHIKTLYNKMGGNELGSEATEIRDKIHAIRKSLDEVKKLEERMIQKEHRVKDGLIN